MNNIMQLISCAINDKADTIIFSVQNGIGNILVKSNMNYWENNLSMLSEDSVIIATCFNQLFEEDFTLENKKICKIFNINDNNYKIDYQLSVKNKDNFNVCLKIKDTNKILFNKKIVMTPEFILWEKIFKIAIEHDVSDIHIQIRDNLTEEQQVLIMFRAYGEVLKFDLGTITLNQAYALCKTIYNIVENKEIDNNDTQEFMNVLCKSIHYPMHNEVYKFAVGATKCYPQGLDMVIRILPVDDVFKE